MKSISAAVAAGVDVNGNAAWSSAPPPTTKTGTVFVLRGWACTTSCILQRTVDAGTELRAIPNRIEELIEGERIQYLVLPHREGG